MNPTTKNVLLGYAAFCLANAGVAYFWARGQPPGTNKLADINQALLRLNVLAWVLPQASGAVIAGAAPSNAVVTFPTLSAPQVTDQATGVTTYFGS